MQNINQSMSFDTYFNNSIETETSSTQSSSTLIQDNIMQKQSKEWIDIDFNIASILNTKMIMNYGVSLFQLYPIGTIVQFLFKKYLGKFEEDVIKRNIHEAIMNNFENDAVKKNIQDQDHNKNFLIQNKNDNVEIDNQKVQEFYLQMHESIKTEKTYRNTTGTSYSDELDDHPLFQAVYNVSKEEPSNIYAYVCITHGQYNKICSSWNTKKINFLSKLFQFIRDYKYALEQLLEPQNDVNHKKSKFDKKRFITEKIVKKKSENSVKNKSSKDRSKKSKSTADYELITKEIEKKITAPSNEIQHNGNLKNSLKNALFLTFENAFKENAIRLAILYNEEEKNESLGMYIEKLEELVKICYNEICDMDALIKQCFDVEKYFEYEMLNWKQVEKLKKRIIDIFIDVDYREKVKREKNLVMISRVERMDNQHEEGENDIPTDKEYLVDCVIHCVEKCLSKKFISKGSLFDQMYDHIEKAMFYRLSNYQSHKNGKTKVYSMEEAKKFQIDLFRKIKYINAVSKNLWGFCYQDTLQKTDDEIDILESHEKMRYNGREKKFTQCLKEFVDLYQSKQVQISFMKNDWRLSNMQENIEKINRMIKKQIKTSKEKAAILKTYAKKYVDIVNEIDNGNIDLRTYTSSISVNEFSVSVDRENLHKYLYAPGSFQSIENLLHGNLICQTEQKMNDLGEVPNFVQKNHVFSSSFVSVFTKNRNSIRNLSKKPYQMTICPIEYKKVSSKKSVLDYVIACMIAGGFCFITFNTPILRLLNNQSNEKCTEKLSSLIMNDKQNKLDEETKDSSSQIDHIEPLIKSIMFSFDFSISESIHHLIRKEMKEKNDLEDKCSFKVLTSLKQLFHQSIEKLKPNNKRLRSTLDTTEEVSLIENEPKRSTTKAFDTAALMKISHKRDFSVELKNIERIDQKITSLAPIQNAYLFKQHKPFYELGRPYDDFKNFFYDEGNYTYLKITLAFERPDFPDEEIKLVLSNDINFFRYSNYSNHIKIFLKKLNPFRMNYKNVDVHYFLYDLNSLKNSLNITNILNFKLNKRFAEIMLNARMNYDRWSNAVKKILLYEINEFGDIKGQDEEEVIVGNDYKIENDHKIEIKKQWMDQLRELYKNNKSIISQYYKLVISDGILGKNNALKILHYHNLKMININVIHLEKNEQKQRETMLSYQHQKSLSVYFLPLTNAMFYFDSHNFKRAINETNINLNDLKINNLYKSVFQGNEKFDKDLIELQFDYRKKLKNIIGYDENIIFEVDLIDPIIYYMEICDQYMKFDSITKEKIILFFQKASVEVPLISLSILTDFELKDCFSILMTLKYFINLYVEDFFCLREINLQTRQSLTTKKAIKENVYECKLLLNYFELKSYKEDFIIRIVEKLTKIKNFKHIDNDVIHIEIQIFLIVLLFGFDQSNKFSTIEDVCALNLKDQKNADCLLKYLFEDLDNLKDWIKILKTYETIQHTEADMSIYRKQTIVSMIKFLFKHVLLKEVNIIGQISENETSFILDTLISFKKNNTQDSHSTLEPLWVLLNELLLYKSAELSQQQINLLSQKILQDEIEMTNEQIECMHTLKILCINRFNVTNIWDMAFSNEPDSDLMQIEEEEDDDIIM